MEDLLYHAQATKNYIPFILMVGCLLALLIFSFLIQTQKLKSVKGTYRQIALLLSGLFGLILLATSIFTFWNLFTIQDIKLYPNHMESYHGITDYKDIKRAGIYKDKQNSFINPQVSIRTDNILVVEKKKGKGKVMLFAEENYNIQELIREIKDRMKVATKGD